MKKRSGTISSIFSREFGSYLDSSIAAIFLIVFSCLSGGLFMSNFFLIGIVDMRPFFDFLPFLLCIFIPALTMRVWAEDKRGNTLEMLLTLPVSLRTLVMGKFLACFLFFILSVSLTSVIVVMLSMLGAPDMGQITASYLGVIFLGAFFIAIGIFISGFCKDQIAAFVLTMLVCFVFFLSGHEMIVLTLDGWTSGFGTFLKSSLSMRPHYLSFIKGVVDLRDVFYFMIGTFGFLLLNSFWLDRRMKPGSKVTFLIGASMVFIIFIGLNWLLSDMALKRFDFTENKRHTVTESTIEIMKDLKVPVLIKYYVTPKEKMPSSLKSLEQNVMDKLEELRVFSEGKFQYEILHMEVPLGVSEHGEIDFTVEGRASEKGIYPFEVKSVKSDELELKLVYSAFGINYKDKPEEIISRFYPENLSELEYLLISKIHKMTYDEPPRIGLIAPYQEQTIDPATLSLLHQLGGDHIPPVEIEDDYQIVEKVLVQGGYVFERIDFKEGDISFEDYTALIILEPKSFNQEQVEKINNFLSEGGSVFLAIQDYELNYTPVSGKLKIDTIKNDSGMTSFLNQLGVQIGPHILADENHDGVQITSGDIFDTPIPVKLPVQVFVPTSSLLSESSLLSGVGSLFYLWGNAIHMDYERLKEHGLRPEIIFSSSEHSWEIDSTKELSVEGMDRKHSFTEGSFPLAILIKGVFPYSSLEGSDQRKVIQYQPSKLLVMGSAMLFRNELIVTGGHLKFFYNALDLMTYGDALSEIRDKEKVDYSIMKVNRSEKFFWRMIVTFLMSMMIILFSVYRNGIRGMEKSRYLKKLAMEN